MKINIWTFIAVGLAMYIGYKLGYDYQMDVMKSLGYFP